MQQALTRYPGELHGILGHIFPCYTKGSFSAAVTRGASAARAGICSSPRPARTSQQQIKKQHSSDVRVRCEAHVLPGAAPRRELCVRRCCTDTRAMAVLCQPCLPAAPHLRGLLLCHLLRKAGWELPTRKRVGNAGSPAQRHREKPMGTSNTWNDRRGS